MFPQQGQSRTPIRLAGLLGAIVVLLVALFAHFFGGPQVTGAPPSSPTVALDAAAVERGNALFTANCVACHGAKGHGDGPAAAALDPKPIDFTSPIHRGHTDADLIKWISNGVAGSAMPAFAGTLTPANIQDLVTFIRSLQAAAPPVPTPNVPDPSTCTVSPRSLESFEPAGTVTPAPAPTTAANVGPEGFQWPQGDPASQDETEGITRTITEFHACANAGDYERRLALYTDRFIRPQFDALDTAGWQQALDYAATPATIVPEGDRQWVDSITLVRKLPDGRVGAYIVAIDPVNHPHQINAVIIFAKEGDRWLIDEVHQDPTGSLAPAAPSPTAAVPSAALGTPVTSGGLVVDLVQAPTAIGTGNFTVRVTDGRGKSVIGLDVSMTLDMSGMPMDTTRIGAVEGESGMYLAELPVSMPGQWLLDVTIKRDGQPDELFRFSFVAG